MHVPARGNTPVEVEFRDQLRRKRELALDVWRSLENGLLCQNAR